MCFGVSDPDISFDSRRWVLERKLASSDVPNEERINLIKDLERKETEYMRLKRHKICVDDFELLTIIGRGAYAEVRTFPGVFVHETVIVEYAIHHFWWCLLMENLLCAYH